MVILFLLLEKLLDLSTISTKTTFSTNSTLNNFNDLKAFNQFDDLSAIRFLVRCANLRCAQKSLYCYGLYITKLVLNLSFLLLVKYCFLVENCVRILSASKSQSRREGGKNFVFHLVKEYTHFDCLTLSLSLYRNIHW